MLNDLEIAIVSTKAMRFTEDEAMAYLKTQGFNISRRTYYYTSGHISAETRKRSFEYAKNFREDHIDTIDELLNIKKIMYQEAIKENDHLKKNNDTCKDNRNYDTLYFSIQRGNKGYHYRGGKK